MPSVGEKNGSSETVTGVYELLSTLEGPASIGKSKRRGSCPASTLPQLVRRRARLALLSAGVSAGEDGVEVTRLEGNCNSIAEEAELSEVCWSELCCRSTID